MKKAIYSIGIIGLFYAIATALNPDGYKRVLIEDLSESQAFTVKEPWPFGSGSQHIAVRGNISGKGILHIDPEGIGSDKLLFHDQTIDYDSHSPEAWVQSLRVVWEPIGKPTGRIDLFLSCGGGYSQYQEWKKQP